MSKKRTRLLFASGAVATLVVLVLLAQLVVGMFSNKCLNGDDYKELTGHDMPAIGNPKSNFYTYIVEFSGDSASSSDTQSTANTLAAFYKAHHRKSILINLSGVNQDTTATATGVARINNFADQLAKGGVKESAVQAAAPQFVATDSDTDGTLTATIVTSGDCKQ
jgi:hypothetical protein